ncbi:hypothetical protein [Maridesulfovibrio ferrireducens]|uniref:hypothetical protein n=1 Tax=Maridesulfovibrio ferrireducens TaxID=246191 RepID=UPI001A21FFD1|nr:hypothetical protein [Maridesulfovibrio ferrireducens]MBI9112224.1 hypothetical protein [Maridesulfovibrio ferrireducens]
MSKQVNPYVNQEVENMRARLLEMRPQLTGRGSAILGGLLVDLHSLKEHAQPQCPPEEPTRRCERGAYLD